MVSEDSEGYLSLCYRGFIPILIEVLKIQKNKIDALESKITDLISEESAYKSALIAEPSVSAFDLVDNAILYQNSPNPFNNDSEIKMQIPETIITAELYVYDLNGAQLKSYAIQERGNSSVTIHGSELNPGMYLYTLIVDGHEVDTKRLILTREL